MTTGTLSAETLARSSGKAVDMFSLWADANQQVVRELVDCWAGAAKEGVRLYAELLSSSVEALRDGQAFVARRQGDIEAAPRDLVGVCQKGALESVDGVHAAWRMLEDNAHTVTRSAERLQATAEQAGRQIQATFSRLAAQAQALYTGA